MRLLATVMFTGILLAASESSAASRFFFSGDGNLSLQHAHFNEQLTARYRDQSGVYDPSALERIARLMRSREDGKIGSISLRLIEMIDFLEDTARPRGLIILSAYRSPEFNDNLRRRGGKTATASLHTEGMAVDLLPVGVDLRKLWLKLRDLRAGGVGYYATQNFLHVDTGPPRFWEQTTSRVGENLAKGNARVFACTDFDRYDGLDGAVVSLHQVTAFPIRVARQARIGSRELQLEPLGDNMRLENGCFVISQPQAAYEFRVQDATAESPAQGARIHVATCSPRVEATATEIETNPIEALR